jgi:hypothetical protein
MAIRLKNLDLNTDGMKRHIQVSLGDITADRSHIIFTAPVACVVNFVDLYSNQANPPATLTASTTNYSATVVAVVNGTATTMVARGTSATQTTSDSISANVRWRLIPTVANSLTQGTQVRLTSSIGGSGTLSAVIAHVTYTPLIHRETR